MYNKHLDTFMSVVETGSFSKAAEQAHISRTALAQQINILEEHLGINLFIRSSKGAVLTPAGKLLAQRTKEIIKISAKTIDDCLALQGDRQIRIGILPNLPLTILTPICIEYAKLYPDTKIVFVERNPSEYLSAFQNNEFDISADYMSKLVSPDEPLLFCKLLTDSFACAVPPNSDLAHKLFITPEDLRGKKACLLVANLAQAEDNMRSYLLNNYPEIELLDLESYKKSLPLTCILNDSVFIHYNLNSKEYLPLVSKPFHLAVPCPIEMGLCYKPGTRAEILNFVFFAQAYCTNKEVFVTGKPG
ncbi:LysR family transcriptional regulator [Phascolarctobacterium sp.]|uniref:LysR family transcriptional regulator n=1 Tax=Phascolarctobacterium sp. TaxID=2049039 RepID=UPI00386FFB8E